MLRELKTLSSYIATCPETLRGLSQLEFLVLLESLMEGTLREDAPGNKWLEGLLDFIRLR